LDLKKKAFDLGLKDLLSVDYGAADKSLAAGGDAYGKDNEASASAYGDAVSRFEDLIARGLPLLAEKARKNAAALRDTAVGKGAGDSFPQLFALAESELAKATGALQAGDFETAIAGFHGSARDYEALYKLCDAKKARDAIVARDFAKWDPSNWNLAEGKYAAAQSLLRQDAPAAIVSVDEAKLRYGIAYGTALEYYANDRKQGSEAQRRRAAGIKAEVAVKKEFSTAVALSNQAETARASGDFEAAASLFDSAASSFASAYGHAKIKMDAARDELDSLDASIAAHEADSASR